MKSWLSFKWICTEKHVNKIIESKNDETSGIFINELLIFHCKIECAWQTKMNINSNQIMKLVKFSNTACSRNDN